MKKKSLPELNKEILNSIFDCVYRNDDVVNDTKELLKNEEFSNLIQKIEGKVIIILKNKRNLLYYYYPLISPILGPFETNSQGTDYWIARCIAIKQIYELKDEKLLEYLKLVTVRK